jgi:hypothetical protein
MAFMREWLAFRYFFLTKEKSLQNHQFLKEIRFFVGEKKSAVKAQSR